MAQGALGIVKIVDIGSATSKIDVLLTLFNKVKNFGLRREEKKFYCLSPSFMLLPREFAMC